MPVQGSWVCARRVDQDSVSVRFWCGKGVHSDRDRDHGGSVLQLRRRSRGNLFCGEWAFGSVEGQKTGCDWSCLEKGQRLVEFWLWQRNAGSYGGYDWAEESCGKDQFWTWQSMIVVVYLLFFISLVFHLLIAFLKAYHSLRVGFSRIF